MPERIVVGRIGPAHGIGGDVYVRPLTDVPEVRFADGMVLAAGPPVSAELTVEFTKDHSGRLLVHFVGIDSRNAAESLRNAELEALVDLDEVPPDEDEYFDRQLIGLAVNDMAGMPIGKVSDVIHLPGQDLLAVAMSSGGERLVPFVSQIVPTVDLAGGFVEIDAPDGLLNDPDDDAAESDTTPDVQS
ncbi:MAG: ribosome maturation factor RimM [Candidatus Nanopelagicales bacterium]